MAKIKRIDLPRSLSDAYAQRNMMNETNDCTVVALSVVTGMSYPEAHKAMQAQGRKPGKGSNGIEKALAAAGFKLKRVNIQSIIDKFPKPHCDVLKNFTTHHPRRFPGCIDKSKVYMAYTNRHVLGIREGEVRDWSINTSLRVYALWEVEKA